MTDVPVRELRNHTRQVIQRAHDGETIVITADGRPMAELRPVPTRATFVSREEFIARFQGHLADPGLTADLAEMLPDTTDDIAW